MSSIFIDNSTLEALDLKYIFDKLYVFTPYGQLLKARMKPFTFSEEKKLNHELAIVESYTEHLRDNSIRREYNNILSHIKEIRHSLRRAQEGFILSDVELFEIKALLLQFRALYEIKEKYNLPQHNETEVLPIEKLEKLLDPENTGIATFYIYDEYSEELRELRKQKRIKEHELKLNNKKTKELVQEALKIELRPDGSLIVDKENKDLLEKVKKIDELTYTSETYLNIRFSIKASEEAVELKRELQILKDKEEREEQRVREELSKEVKKRYRHIYRNLLSVGKLDLTLSKVRLAIDLDCVKPIILDEHIIEINEGIYPKTSELLNKRELIFTPISIRLKPGVTCITGANMGGKTITLKLVGQFVAMAQYGLFVPAKNMKLGLGEFIKSSIGDMQSTDSGLSTFGGEIKVVEEAMKRANDKGLILIDELARGTNPEEGYAISKAIVKHLSKKASITLITTHYDNVADLEEVAHLQVIGLSNIDLKELKKDLESSEGMDIINRLMDYRLKEVAKSKSIPRDAINIAAIMGLNDEILQLAESILIEELKERSE